MSKYLYILSISLTCFLNSTLLHGQANDSLQIVHQLDSIYKITLQTVGNGQLNEAIALAKEGLNLSISQSKGFTKKQVKFYSIVARIYHQMGDFENAKFNYLKAIGILENDMYSKKAYSELLHDLGILYINVNSLDEAEQMLRKSLDLSEQLNGRNSFQYAESLLGFAPFQIQKGNFTVADSIFNRAIEILKSIKDTIPVPNADLIKLYAFGLYAYANFLHMRGNDQKSEKYYLNSRDLYAENYISDSIHYGELLVNIGIFYFDRGDFTQAEDYLKTSIEIGKRTIGENHPNYGARLEVLANLYGTKHLYQKAINLYYEVGRICIINYGENCMDYIRFLMNQGTTYYLEHKLDSADLYQSKALTIYNKFQTEKDDTWAKMLNDIGSTKSELGQFQLADSLFKEVNHFCESSLSTNSDIYLLSLINLGINASRAHDYEKSKNYFSQSRNLYQNHVINSSSYATESELQAFINLYLPFNDIYSSFSFEHADPQLAESLYNMALFDKGYVLNEIKMIKRKLESDTIAQNLYTKLSSIRYELASLYSHPLNEANQIHVLEENCNQIEKVIVTRSIDFSLLFEPTTWINVQAQLKNDEAAIEFIHFNLYKEMRITDSILYCAILIRPNLIHPVFIPLFESRQFNKPNALTSASKSAFFEDLYGNEDAHLYQLIWEPLESQLTGCKVIYFSPSGLLYTVNLGAIMRPNHEIISSAYDLVSLGSTREIILNKVQPVSCSSMSMFAGITYDIDTTMIKKSVDYSMENEKEDETINSIPFDNTLRGGNWSGLPGSMTEMNNIVPILERNHLQVKVSSQNMATEEKFKDLGRSSTYKLSTDIIHISTHGFFFPDPVRDSPNKDSSTLEQIFKVSNNPMLRSGLILAGGNYAWTHGHPFKPGMEDGILTAYEISQMDLSNTELVVLSACETGLGDIEGNEGVFGLQRAFKIAGVKNLIMSLWQVPDAATAELMTSFYKHWLEDKMTIRDALHTAQKEMREEGWEVYDWAGFILVE